MPHWQGKLKIEVVTTYMRPDGVPDFTINQVEVTEDEHANGVHYELVEAILAEAGFEEPLIHFDQLEAPPFLVAAVKQYLESTTNVSHKPDFVLPF
jgi:hypothetical protein